MMLLAVQNRQALPCPQGTWKQGIDKATACTPCPVGITTQAVGSITADACAIAKTLGFRAVLVDGNMVAQPCPVGTYGNNGRDCLPCTDGLTTAQEASSNIGACLAGPGYGYDAALAGTNKVYVCPTGSYKVGLVDCCSRMGPAASVAAAALSCPDSTELRLLWCSALLGCQHNTVLTD